MKTEYQKMISGDLYIAKDNEIATLYKHAIAVCNTINLDCNLSLEEKNKMIKDLFLKTGNSFFVMPPFRCDYGCHISVGENFYANYDCIFLDTAPITIGNNVFLAPRVCLFTAGHPIDKDIRNEQLEYGKPIIIGDDVWIGGGVIVNPGVSIGSNVVIGSGSVVVNDLPSNTVCAGNPCKVKRKITEEDKLYWEKEKEIYIRNK
ncbi:MAG: sugar O-acetyltransferase [Bacilli bacterium]